MQCHGCGAEIQAADKIFREDTCPSCGRPLHACRNCTFHDPAAHHQCRETQAEWVGDKGAANFCDYFRPAGPGRSSGTQKGTGSLEARRRLDDLFKK